MSLAERITQRLYCLGCGRRYQRHDLQLVGAGSDELDLYMHCNACGLYLQLTVAEQDAAVSSVVVAMPGPAREWQEEPRGAPVTVEDVTDMQRFLISFAGDIQSLLGARGDDL